ncbi:MAG: metal-dependent hydrolase [Candidatus Methanoperedens sp.]|nr:metal-dependent hydrolase [Candidatus Methanoperedens sp.]
MDLFTHALLPYLLAKSFKRKNEETTAFVLGGIAPDIDVLIMWINFVYPTFFLITHRGITHSLFFGFITAIFVLYLASRTGIRSFINRFIKFEPVINGRSAVFACAGATLHIFLDYMTTHGVPLLYPLTTTRYSAELFFYTDLFLTILSLLIIIYLYKKPQQKNTAVKFLFVFLLIFALLGTVRTVEKSGAEGFFNNTEMKAYPTTSPFDWYVMGGIGEEIRIFEYNGLERRSQYNETVKRIDVLKSGDGMDRALSIAEELPQVKMFRWRAYAVALNASFEEETWSFIYYDPVQRAMFKDMPPIFKGVSRGFSSMNVTVKGNTVVVK